MLSSTRLGSGRARSAVCLHPAGDLFRRLVAVPRPVTEAAKRSICMCARLSFHLSRSVLAPSKSYAMAQEQQVEHHQCQCAE